jgi:hypothetical protein
VTEDRNHELEDRKTEFTQRKNTEGKKCFPRPVG